MKLKIKLLAALLAVMTVFTGCSNAAMQTSDLTSGLEDAWDEAAETIEKDAAEYLEEAAENPAVFGKESYQAEWNGTFDTFTLTYSVDMGSKAAMSLIFGEFGESLYDMVNASVEVADKKSARKIINKSFNDSWATLMMALIAVDGTLDYGFATDEFNNKEFEFDSKDMLRMLKDHGYIPTSAD